jgi:hypothetical protein
MSTDDLPNGWDRIEDTDQQGGQYNPQQPIQYERDSLELHLQPATNAADTDQDVWQVNVIRTEGDGPEVLREEIEGRDTAIGTAREFMEAYNERHVEGDESVDDLISSF